MRKFFENFWDCVILALLCVLCMVLGVCLMGILFFTSPLWLAALAILLVVEYSKLKDIE